MTDDEQKEFSKLRSDNAQLLLHQNAHYAECDAHRKEHDRLQAELREYKLSNEECRREIERRDELLSGGAEDLKAALEALTVSK